MTHRERETAQSRLPFSLLVTARRRRKSVVSERGLVGLSLSFWLGERLVLVQGFLLRVDRDDLCVE